MTTSLTAQTRKARAEYRAAWDAWYFGPDSANPAHPTTRRKEAAEKALADLLARKLTRDRLRRMKWHQ